MSTPTGTEGSTQEPFSQDPLTPQYNRPWARLRSRCDLPSFELVKDEYVIGRNEGLDIRIDRPVVSANHCRLVREVSQKHSVIWLYDTSSNGTFINFKKIGKGNKRILRHKDTVQLVYANENYSFDFFVESTEDEERKLLSKTGLLEKYRLLSEIGSGNFSRVRLGMNKVTNQRVAIKIIDKEKYKRNARDQSLIQLKRETELLMTLKHRFIVSIHDVFEDENYLILVLELAEGGDLFESLKIKETFTETDARRIFRQILEALQYLHSKNIAHRDLKPENVLLETSEPNSNIKLTDFGLARPVDAAGKMSTMCGTPTYVAPEVLYSATSVANSYGLEVDMWSAGVLLYVLLSGYPPFHHTPDMPLFDRISTGMYDFAPEEEWEQISTEAKELISQLIEVDVSKRLTVHKALAHPWFGLEEVRTASQNSSGCLSQDLFLDHVQKNLRLYSPRPPHPFLGTKDSQGSAVFISPVTSSKQPGKCNTVQKRLSLDADTDLPESPCVSDTTSSAPSSVEKPTSDTEQQAHAGDKRKSECIEAIEIHLSPHDLDKCNSFEEMDTVTSSKRRRLDFSMA